MTGQRSKSGEAVLYASWSKEDGWTDRWSVTLTRLPDGRFGVQVTHDGTIVAVGTDSTLPGAFRKAAQTFND